VTQFTTQVRRLTGLTPERFLIECRLQHAAALLRHRPDLSILEVALACGFSSSQHFATLFRRRFRSTPTAWRAADRTDHLNRSRLEVRSRWAPERPIANSSREEKSDSSALRFCWTRI
jgi:AraC-like DNA-binding protein